MKPVRQAASSARRAARALGRVLADVSYWQRRSAVLALAPDRFARYPNRAPDTYDEFLARTSGPLLREPSCGARLTGRRVG